MLCSPPMVNLTIEEAADRSLKRCRAGFRGFATCRALHLTVALCTTLGCDLRPSPSASNREVLASPSTVDAQAQPQAGANRLVEIRRVARPRAAIVDLAAHDGIWAATRGGGLMQLTRGGTRYFDIGDLPSAVVWQVGINAEGTVYAGTQHGLVAVRDDGEVRPAIPPDSIGFDRAAADLVIASKQSSEVVFQLTTEGGHEARPVSALWLAQGDAFTRWQIRLPPGAEATAGFYDTRSDCFWVAGVVRAPGGGFAPWLARRCDGEESAMVFSSPVEHVIGVSGVALDREDRPVLSLVTRKPRGGARRDRLFIVGAGRKLVPHCAADPLLGRVVGMIRHARDRRLLVALRRRGVWSAECPPRVVVDQNRLDTVTALAADARGVLIATTDGVWRLGEKDAVERLFGYPETALPPEAIPFDSNAQGRVLLSAEREGVFELRGSKARRIGVAPKDLKPAVFGPALYGSRGEIYAILKSKGVLYFASASAPPKLLSKADGLLSEHVLHLSPSANGFWAAFGATPFDSSAAGIQLFEGRSIQAFHTRTGALSTVGALLSWPEYNRVWAATRTGVVELDASGKMERKSRHGVTALYRDPITNTVAAVGSTIERWDGQKFSPVLFAVEGQYAGRPMGHAVDVVIDDKGWWLVLFSRGFIVVLDQHRRFRTALGPGDGVPPTARALLRSEDGTILLGSAREGLFTIAVRHGGEAVPSKKRKDG